MLKYYAAKQDVKGLQGADYKELHDLSSPLQM